MFLIDKYQLESNKIVYHKKILERLINWKNINQEIDFNNKDEFIELLRQKYNNENSFNNLPNLLFYGSKKNNIMDLINHFLIEIFDESINDLKKVTYEIKGYGSGNTEVDILQSNYHIIIEPKNNGFDKYLIQEVVKEYAKEQSLQFFKTKKKFKIVVINTIDNLSFYAQTYLRRTMEKYINNCKFFLISNQLSNTIEPLRSRCVSIKIPVPSDITIMNLILDISLKEKLNLTHQDCMNILQKCDGDINKVFWLIEIHHLGLEYLEPWKIYLKKIISYLSKINKNTKPNEINQILLKSRDIFYNIFISNIDVIDIIKELMINLTKLDLSPETRYNIIDETTKHEYRLKIGKRHIIHLESYLINIIQILIN
jgi:replication factor C subunit 3/5